LQAGYETTWQRDPSQSLLTSTPSLCDLSFQAVDARRTAELRVIVRRQSAGAPLFQFLDA